MRDDDGLANNPTVSRGELLELHEAAWGWALSRSDYVPHVAEDLMQQAYVEILSGSARFDGRSSLRTFLFGVIQTLARSRYRRLRTRLKLLRDFADQPDSPPDPPPAGAEHGAAVWRAVAALPARQRDVTELVFLRELSIAEAATVIGISLGTARVHYDRAKKALAAELADLRLGAADGRDGDGD